ncbi:MAG: sigma 54-interacting transcriptional regulator [Gemmatimonadetes bacterium]|nr:sigma 54-interacting transcriptional regulator [Gemmatimonadota bacterium]
MTYRNQPRLGRKLKEISEVLGVPDRTATSAGDLGSLYLGTDHYLDAIREFEAVLQDETGATSPAVQDSIREKLAWCHYYTGHFDEAEETMRELEASVESRPGLLLLLARIDLERGQPQLSRAKAERSLALSRELGDEEWLGQTHSLLGVIAHRSGQTEAARGHYEEALLSYRIAGDPDGEARSFIHLGTLAKSECRWDEALRYLQRARARADEEGFYYLFGSASLNLGNLRYRLGELPQAFEATREAKRVFHEIGYRLGEARALLAEARVHLDRDDRESFDRCVTEGESICRDGGFKRELAFWEVMKGEAALHIGDDGAAKVHLQQGLRLAREISPNGDLAVRATLHLAGLCLRNRDAANCRALLDSIADAQRELGDPAQEGWMHRLHAEASRHEERYEEASDYAQRAITCFERIGYRQELAEALTVSGRVAASDSRGEDTERVLSHYLRAKRIWDDLASHRNAAGVSLEIARFWLGKEDLDEALSYVQKAHALFARAHDEAGLLECNELLRHVESRFADAMFETPDPAFASRNGSRGELSEGLAYLLGDALRRSRSARGWIASGTNLADLNVLAQKGLPGDEAEAAIAHLLAEDPTFLDSDRPLFLSGLDARNRLARDRTVVVLPFAIHDGARGILYVDRPSKSGSESYRFRDLQVLSSATHAIAKRIAEHQKSELLRENFYLKEKLENRYPFANIVTEHPKMIETLSIASRIADYPITAMLDGETGTGKQLLARAIHDSSDRAKEPFVTLNCASLPEQILESELFGYVKGAFTGALEDRKGLFEEADGGTIFLDEIGKAGAHVQRALLHVLDQGIIRPVGSNTHREVDVRVICATSNTQLLKDIEEGLFLKDLYYRVNDICLSLPPLRERASDIPLLADTFLEAFRQKIGRDEMRFAPAVYAALEAYDWPGNVRELEKAVQRATLLAPTAIISVDSLPAEVRAGAASGSAPATSSGRNAKSLKEEVEELERRRVAEALLETNGNRSAAARVLGLSIRGLRNKIKRYELG